MDTSPTVPGNSHAALSRGFAVVLFIALSGASLAAQEATTDEPVASYVLRIDGQRVPLEPGEAVRIDGTFTDPEVSLEVSETRLFAEAGVRFAYPASFAYTASDRGAYRRWSLSGGEVSLVVLAFNEEVGAGEFARLVAARFEEGEGRSTERAPTTLNLGGEAVAGVRLSLTEGSGPEATTQVQRIVQPDGLEGRVLLIFQQPAEGQPGHGAKALELLRTTFALEAGS
jgi:hypothetical protein